MKIEQSDAWVLLSICACKGETGTLEDIIAVGDYINHAIMTKDELFGSIRRLHGAGLIFQKGDRYKPAPRVKRKFASIQKTLRNRYLRILRVLKPYLHRIEKKEPIGKLGPLRKKDYDKAVKHYRDNF